MKHKEQLTNFDVWNMAIAAIVILVIVLFGK